MAKTAKELIECPYCNGYEVGESAGTEDEDDNADLARVSEVQNMIFEEIVK